MTTAVTGRNVHDNITHRSVLWSPLSAGHFQLARHVVWEQQWVLLASEQLAAHRLCNLWLACCGGWVVCLLVGLVDCLVGALVGLLSSCQEHNSVVSWFVSHQLCLKGSLKPSALSGGHKSSLSVCVEPPSGVYCPKLGCFTLLY